MYIELEHISKYFGTFKASDDVSFGIEKGKLVGLLGPSGSGKTTILRMLAGLEKQDEGDVIIDGKNVNALTPDQRKIGFVFQSYALFPYMTVYDNIAYGLKVQKRDKKFIKNRVHEPGWSAWSGKKISKSVKRWTTAKNSACKGTGATARSTLAG